MIQKGTDKHPLHIFLSSAPDDRPYARKLQNLLSRRPDVTVFTTETLSAGEDWESRLREELSKCDVFLVLLSPNSVDSKWVLHELGAAWAIGKRIISIATDRRISSKIPLSLPELIETEDLGKPEIINQILALLEKAPASDMSG